MPGPPPPPPPPPPPGAAGGPPAPPPPPPGGLPSRPPAKASKDRGALLGDIQKGARLKKVTQINDRSAPQVGKVVDGPAKGPMGAPPVPGSAPKPPGGLAPPVPGNNRARSNSDTGESSGGGAASGGAPQLAGIFAGVGMPKLRKTGKSGVDTGADKTDSPYLSDPETTRSRTAPKPPTGAAPAPPSAPRPPGSAPPLPPSIAALKSNLRPSSSYGSLPSGKPKPPPPVGKKPPVPPPASRKPSAPAPPPPASSAPAPPGAPPPPPSSAPRPPSRATPPPPPGPPPPPTNGHTPSLAEQAARNAFGRASPAAPPPPPPASPPRAPPSPAPAIPSAPPPPPSAAPSAPPPPPGGIPVRAPTMSAPPPPPAAAPPPRAATMNASSFTLTNGGSAKSSAPVSPGMIRINDGRWKFQDDSQLPKPRDFTGGPKKYRAGRGSTVPLDLSAFE